MGNIGREIMNIHELNTLPKIVTSEDVVAIDTEFIGMDGKRLHRPTGTFASLQLCIGEDVYIVTDETILGEAWELIKDAGMIVGYNLMFDLRHLRRYVDIHQRKVWDGMLVEQNLWGGYYAVGEFSLADCVRRYLNVLLDKHVREDFSTASSLTPDMLQYAAQDVYYTLRVYEKQQEEIENRKCGFQSYWEVDEPTIWTFLDLKPVKINTKRWMELAAEHEQKGKEIEDELGINVNSVQQVKSLVRTQSGIELENAQAETLKFLADKIGKDLVDKILSAKSYRKAASTYGSAWISNFVEENNLVYADWHVTGAESGRTSCSNPNLLNIPARKFPEFRKLFVSNKGRFIIADISQQEPRILAALSQDKELLRIFRDGEDIHLAVARAIFNAPDMTKDDPRRDIGKMINLATTYGISAVGLSKRLNIDEDTAQKFLDSYFMRFPEVRMYIDRMRMLAQKLEYVESIVGRRIWINPHNFQSDNNAINAPIQSSAADFTKIWVNKFRTMCLENDKEFPAVLIVYDEVVIDVPKEEVEWYKDALTTTFDDTAMKLFPTVPFEMDIEVGTTWAAKKEREDELEEVEL